MQSAAARCRDVAWLSVPWRLLPAWHGSCSSCSGSEAEQQLQDNRFACIVLLLLFKGFLLPPSYRWGPLYHFHPDGNFGYFWVRVLSQPHPAPYKNHHTPTSFIVYLFASKMVRSACILVIGVCLLAARASAHGGALHPGGPEQNNYIRAKVASCSNWVPATGTLKAGKVVPSSAKLAPITVQVRTTPCWDRAQANIDYCT